MCSGRKLMEKWWGQKRLMQGFSFDEVGTEILRRTVENKCGFSKRENGKRLKRALRDAEIQFRLSSHLHDFFELQNLHPKMKLNIYDESTIDDALRLLLDPFPVGKTGIRIEFDPLIDLLYPGPDYEKIVLHNYVQVKKK